jgi:hypothetical protein
MLVYNSNVRIPPLRTTLILGTFAASFSLSPVSLPASAQIAPAAPPANDTSHVTCGDKPPFSTRVVRSDVLISPDGKHRAYAEVEAKALHPQRPPGYSGPLCVNNSRLFAANEGPDYKIVFLQEPSDQETGNSLRPVDWSVDSRRLLLELAEFQYETPSIARTIVIYDSRNGTFQQPDLLNVFRNQFRIDCSLDIHVLGFTGEGRIAFETQPLTPEEEEVLSVPSCSRKKEIYEMDRTTETIVAIPAPPKIQHYAKTEPPPSK